MGGTERSQFFQEGQEEAKKVTKQGQEGSREVEKPKCEYYSGNMHKIEGIVNIPFVISAIKKTRTFDETLVEKRKVSTFAETFIDF